MKGDVVLSSADQVRETLDQWLAAFNAKDTDTLFSLYDPETVYANAGAPRMEGVASLKPWYESVLEGRSLHVYFKEEDLFESDGLALIAGKFHFKNRQADGSYSPGSAGISGRPRTSSTRPSTRTPGPS